MLGLSLSKILVTILIVVAVWKGFAMLNRLANERQAAVKRRATDAARPSRRARPGTVELRACPSCGAYVDPREDCRCGGRGSQAQHS